MKVGSYYATSHSGGSAEHAGSRLRGLSREALAFLFAFLFALGSLVPRAYAGTQYNPQMVIDGNLVDGEKKGYMCVNANRFTATLELIGKMGDYVTIDSDKYRALTSAGGFFMVMQRWDELTSDATADMENSWLGSDSFVDGWLIIAGQGNCWYGTFSDSEIEAALVWYERVMSGESGGSSGGELGDEDGFKTVTLTARLNPYEDRTITINEINSLGYTNQGKGTVSWGSAVGSLTWNEGYNLKMYIDTFSLSKIRSDIETAGGDPDSWHFVYCRSWGTTYVVVSEQPIEFVRVNGETSPTFRIKNTNDESIKLMSYDSYRTGIGRYNGSVCCLLFDVVRRYNVTLASGATYTAEVRPYWNSEGDISDPDEPTVPDEPDVPTVNPPSPDAPDIGTDDPSPTVPRPTNPTQPTNVTINQVLPVDDILDALNKIIEALEEHCVHLQNKMVECANYLGALSEQVRDGIADGFDANMEYQGDLHTDMKSYLQECMQWLVDHLSYNVTVEGDDNTDLEKWLALIYMQDGLGEYNSKPIDITQSYTLYADWVDRLLGYVLPDLTDTNLAPVTNAFDALDDKFPFSVPGDVLRIFQSLDRSPVTPVVAVTIPSVLGIPAYTYSFDLSPYDTTMQTIRTIELMAFVVFLLVWARRAFNAEAGGASD